MESQWNLTPKDEIFQRVIQPYQSRLGCRKIAATLQSEGIDISKDKAWIMTREYEAKANKGVKVEGRGLKNLRQKEEHLATQLELQRKKEACRKRVVDLIVDLLMTSYEKRRQHFSDKTKLFQLAETIMPVRNPYLWKRFLDFCEDHSDSAIAVFTAIGGQENFEEQLVENSSSERLDDYIERRLRESLDAWTETFEEEESEEDEEASYEASESEASSSEWVDAQGYSHISIPIEDDQYDEYH